MNEQAQWNSWCHFEAVGDGAEVHSNRALGEKWFQKLVITALITYSALSFPPSTSLFPLYICLYLAAVYGQTFVTLPPCLRLLLSFSVCEAMEIVLFFNSAQLFFPQVFAFGSQTSFFFYLCASVRATTTVLEGVFTDSPPHVRMFCNGHICCADAHSL